MKLQELKKLPDIQGVTLEADTVGARVQRLHIRYPGGYLLIEHQDYLGLKLFCEASPVMKKAFHVSGKTSVNGSDFTVPVDQTFSEEHEAKALVDADSGLTVSEIEVPDTDIPF
jgi:hypothetical protein